MRQKLQLWYSRHKVLSWTVAALFVFYNLVGYVAIPLIFHNVLKNKISPALGRQVQAVSVRSNPYTFSVRLTRLSVSEPGGEDFIKVGKVYVNLDPMTSLFKWGLVVDSVEIVKPEVNLVRLDNNRFNFSDLLPATEEEVPADESVKSELLRLVLNGFKLSDGEIHFVDRAASAPFETTLSALNVATFSPVDTDPEAKAFRFELSARTEAHEAFEVDGQIDIDPMNAEAQLKVNGFSLAKYAPYYQPYLNAGLTDGRVGVHAKVNWSEDVQTVSEILFTLNRLVMVSDQNEALVDVPRFEVEGADADLLKKQVRLGRITTREGNIHVQFDADGQLNLLNILSDEIMTGSAPAEQAAEGGAAGSDTWHVSVPEFAMQGYAVHYQDRQTDPTADFTIHGINLNIKDLTSRKDERATADLAFDWADQGTVAVQGEAGLFPLQADMAVTAKALDIRPLQPYVNDLAQLVVTNGSFDTKGELKITPGPQEGMDIQYTGQAAVNDFKSVDARNADGFSNWKSLYISGLEIGTEPLRVYVNEVSMSDFFKRLIINADGTSNLALILAARQAVNQKDAQAAQPESMDRKPSETQVPAQKQPARQAPEAAAGPDIKIKTVILQGGRVEFTDRFVKPNIQLRMSQVGGRVSGLDAIKTNKADVLLKGMVRGNVPMEIKGQINPLIEKPFANITIGLDAVDLSPFTPYSGKYLGYTLQKGQLSLNLSYKIEENKLVADNKVLLSQLTLGDTVDSPDATKLPVKLALALLKDRQGNIDIDLPVSGELDDPEFSIGGIVLKMFVNLIVDIVSSPFKALGALFGGGEELAYLEFDAGRSVITPERAGNLDTLAKIMYERPGLNLEIQGQVKPDDDAEGLRQLQFEEQLKAAKLKKMMARGIKAMPLDQIELTPEERMELVQQAYDDAEFPKPRDEKGKLKKLELQEMEKLLYTAIEIADGDLRLLAHQRASVAKDYLVNVGEVEIGRLFIVEPKIEGAGTDDKEGLRSRVKFNLT